MCHWNHHDPTRARALAHCSWQPCRVSQHEFLQRTPSLKFKYPPAAAPNCPPGDFKKPDPRRIDAKFGMQSALTYSQLSAQILEGSNDFAGNLMTEPRWGQIDRFFEKRPRHRVGFLKDSQDLQAPAFEQTVYRIFEPINVIFNKHRIFAQFPLGIQQAVDPLERSTQFPGVIAANHTTAGG